MAFDGLSPKATEDISMYILSMKISLLALISCKRSKNKG
jgi:hypothetical protein